MLMALLELRGSLCQLPPLVGFFLLHKKKKWVE
jgi:hypothetical protein